MRHLLPSLVLCALSGSIAAAATFTLRPDASGSANGDAFVTTGPEGGLADSNYGGAGALAVSGAAGSKGQFASLIRFDLAAATAAFDAEYGAGGWVVKSVVLEISSSAANNPIFNANTPGQFAVSWLAADAWSEGTGNPNNPQSSGVVWNDLAGLMASQQALGVFSFDGIFPQASQYTLTPPAGLLADLAAGDPATLHFAAVDEGMSMVFNARSFGTAAARPALIVTVKRAVPGMVLEPGAITANSAVLQGVASAGGGELDLFFEYGESESFGFTVAASPGSVTGDTDTPVSATISGLQPATTYFFRLKGVDGVVTHHSPSRSFTTAGVAAIRIEQPEGAVLESGVSTVDFGQVTKGRTLSLELVIRNQGSGDLELGEPAIDGAPDAGFFVDQPEHAVVPPGAHSIVRVTFAADGTGPRSATLRVPSNDPDTANFSIALTAGAMSAGPASLRLGWAVFIVLEEPGAFARIPVIRDGDSDTEVTVVLEMLPDSASSADYVFTAAGQALTFPAFGANELFVDVPIVNDGIDEANELFFVRLSNPSGPAPGLGLPSAATVTILDGSALHFDGDKKAPSLKLGSLAQNARVNLNEGDALLLTGSAADDKGVREVEFSLNDGPFASAGLSAPGAPKTEWTAEILPNTGVNTLKVRALDFAVAGGEVMVVASSVESASVTVTAVPAGLVANSEMLGRRVVAIRGRELELDGNADTSIATPTVVPFATAARVSAAVTRVFTVRRPLRVTLNGDGKVTAGFAPFSFRDPGRELSLQASGRLPARVTTANPGTIFSGWEVASVTQPGLSQEALLASIGIDEAALAQPKLTFVFREGLALTANFSSNPFASLAGACQGLIHADTGTAPGHASEGLFTASLSSRGSFSAKIQIEGSSHSLSGVFDHLGSARFGRQRENQFILARRGKPPLRGALQIEEISGVMRITSTLEAFDPQTGAVLARSRFEAARAAYNGRSAATSVEDAYLTVPSSEPAPKGRKDGVFNVLFPALAPHEDGAPDPDALQVPGFAKGQYPQGAGAGTLKVSKNGLLRFSATLADGAKLTLSSKLSAANQAPFFAPLYSRKGFVSFDLQLDHTQADSDVAAAAGTRVLWCRPASSGSLYPGGWPGVIRLDFLGAKYLGEGVVLRQPDGAPPGDPDPVNGNARRVFSDGRLVSPLIKLVNVGTGGAVGKVPDPADASHTLKLNARTGVVSGGFLHEDGSRPAYQAVILQKGTRAGAHGFFLTKQARGSGLTTESGGVRLTAQP